MDMGTLGIIEKILCNNIENKSISILDGNQKKT
jgi:hypothetical protein